MNRRELGDRINALLEMAEGLASAARVLQRQLSDMESGQQELLGLAVPILTPQSGAKEVIMRVAAILGSTLGEVRGPSRATRNSRARHASALALHRCKFSQSEIGRLLGGRDHSTAANSIARAQDIEQSDHLFARAVRRGVALGLGEVEVDDA